MAYVTTLDNKKHFTQNILIDESVANGASTVDFTRQNLTDDEFDLLVAAGTATEIERQFYVTDKNNLDQRDEIINIVSISGNNMDAGTEIVISLYTNNAGLFHTITKTLGAVTAGSNEQVIAKDVELRYADYFTIQYKFIQGASTYIVNTDLIVKKKIVEIEGENFEDTISTATVGQSVFTATHLINNVYVDSIVQTTSFTGRTTNSITFSPALSGGEEVYLTT